MKYVVLSVVDGEEGWMATYSPQVAMVQDYDSPEDAATFNVGNHPDAAKRGKPYQVIVDVHLVLVRNGQVLLGLRVNTSFADGCWHLPAGHVERDEPLPDAAAREAREELGIGVDSERTDLVHVMHQPGRIATFFTTERWRGQVSNMEPDKCAELAWFDLHDLPRETTPYCRAALEAITEGIPFSTFGWNKT